MPNYIVPYQNSFWISQIKTWIKTKYGDVGRFTYILKLLEQDKALYQSDQLYMFEKLEQQRFQQQYSHLSSTNKKIQSLRQIQLEYDLILEQIKIKQAEYDEIISKIKSVQQIPTENYLILEQIKIKQAEYDEIISKIKSVQQKQAKYDLLVEQIKIKQDKFHTMDKHTKTYELDKKIREKNVLFNSIGEQCDEQQQNEVFLFLCKLRNDVKTLQSDKSKLDKKINTIKEALKVFDTNSS